MPSYCTVCGVKLTAKNRISYRPSSCRDCELERKRLYSLKRKLQKEQENAAKGAKTTKTKAKEEKKSTKTKVVKGTSATKAKIVTKVPTKAKAAAKSTATTRAKRSTSKASTTKTTAAKTKSAAVKKEVKVKVKVKAKTKTTNKEIKAKTTTKAKATAVKAKAAEEKETKAKTTKAKAKAKEPTKTTATKKEETKVKESKASAKYKAVEKTEKKEANPFVALPSYIKDSAKIKVKKRRLSKDKKSSSTSAKELPSLSSEGDASHIFSLGKELSEDDLLRAPSETPWDSSSFKIVNGSFVEHGVEDQEESRGPSPEEIKNIIEKIRLEHKTRRS